MYVTQPDKLVIIIALIYFQCPNVHGLSTLQQRTGDIDSTSVTTKASIFLPSPSHKPSFYWNQHNSCLYFNNLLCIDQQ